MGEVMRRGIFVIVLLLGVSHSAFAECANRYLFRREGANLVLTLYTGNLNYEEAQALRQSIMSGKEKPLQWVTTEGRVVATQQGELRVVRPMAGGCSGRTSAVILALTFVVAEEPAGTMLLKTSTMQFALEKQR